MPDIERRVSSVAWPDQDMEIRGTGDGLAFSGYAAIFDSRSEDLGGFRETIRPGAFAKTLAERRGQRMLWNHNQDVVLGSTRSGTLRLSEDERGLRVEADLPDNAWGRPVADAIARGDVDAMSFGFQAIQDSWAEGGKTRTLVEVRLIEVSPVVWPAYPATEATVRHLAEAAGVGEALMQAALDALRGDEPLSDEHREALVAAIHARSSTRYVTTDVAAFIADRRARLARLVA